MATAVPPPTPITAIPRCWTRPAGPPPVSKGHEWGGICQDPDTGGCADWWERRSRADARTARDCDDPRKHLSHLWTRAGDEPPQPFTMWVCDGRPIDGPPEAAPQ